MNAQRRTPLLEKERRFHVSRTKSANTRGLLSICSDMVEGKMPKDKYQRSNHRVDITIRVEAGGLAQRC